MVVQPAIIDESGPLVQHHLLKYLFTIGFEGWTDISLLSRDLDPSLPILACFLRGIAHRSMFEEESQVDNLVFSFCRQAFQPTFPLARQRRAGKRKPILILAQVYEMKMIKC